MNYQFNLIGYPIKHSLSPWIHKQFLEKMDIKGSYTLNEIEDFENEIEKLKETSINGFNITVPYKEKIMSHLDEVDSMAVDIGAVNTVLVKEGKWIGYNTDGIGYLRALQDEYSDLKDLSDKKIVLLGAGGAAKGIYAAFRHAKSKQIVIANRTVSKGEAIIEKNRNKDFAVSLEDVNIHLSEADVIVQTSSVGMKPNSNKMIVDLPQLKENVVVSDIVYQPIETKFLREAKKQKVRVHYGHTMLLYQAQYAFEIWTGIKPELGNMSKELENILKEG